MRQVNDVVLNALDDTSRNGSTLDSNQMINMSFHCVVSDATGAGTFKIQASNDVMQVGQTAQNFVPTNWVDIPSATVTMAAGVQKGLITLTNCPYRWVRAVWTSTTPGNGTVKVMRFGMGA